MQSLKDKILSVFKSYRNDNVRFINGLLRNDIFIKLRKQIKNNTKFLNKYGIITITERIFCIINKLSDRPKCKNCESKVKFRKGKYPSFCSGQCVGIYNKDKIGKSNRANYKKRGNEINSKRKNTVKKRYKVNNVMQMKSIKNKVRKTMKENSGYEFALQNPVSREKYKETCLKKFGNENPSQNEIIKVKRGETCIERFGVPSYFQTAESRQALQDTLKKEYNVQNACQISPVSYSKISQELFWEIYNKLPKRLKKKTYFAELNKEFDMYDHASKNFYCYDFVISNIKFCLEFYGDFWHCNPKRFKDTDINHKTKLKAKDVWNADKIKINCLESKGYDVMIVWEDNYINNKNNVVKSILNKLNKL